MTPLSQQTLPFKERRAFPRYPCRVCLVPNVELVDISEGGAQLEGPWHVPLRAIVPMPVASVFGDRLNLLVPLQILHVRQLPETGRHRIHGRFLDLPYSQMATLREAVRLLGKYQTSPTSGPWSPNAHPGNE